MVDEIQPGKKLTILGSIVVSGPIPGVVEANLGAYLDSAPDVMAEVECVFRVFGGDSGSLAFLVVDELGTEAYERLAADLAI